MIDENGVPNQTIVFGRTCLKMIVVGTSVIFPLTHGPQGWVRWSWFGPSLGDPQYGSNRVENCLKH